MLSVQNYMTDSVYTIKPTDSLHDVKQLMEGAQIRHAPVVNSDGRFCGLVTHRDLLNHTISQLADIDEQTKTEINQAILVKDIMQTDIVCAAPDLSIAEAGNLLLKLKYGCLPVVVGDILVGILTEADFIKIALSLLPKEEEESTHA
ncbi:CBS domain-containing protein [Taurinivorans muris]|uniref:CBS domain-containing protein n=1 Tax=Taurinivorans muris TaxID=2787751 RepID=A0ABY5XZR1_9BACT|nr:CBS domain-containing protein [Desulfovibrionaceae bacterium LT0009]